MSTDKRSVSTDALETLGTIIDDSQKRDAIHLAVLPLKAPQRLMPGQHVDKVGWPVAAYSRNAVGIVDPFIDAPYVPEGENFWLVIYPRVITSLRHVWSHPAFAEEASTAAPSKSASEQWMRKWAVEHMGTDYYGDNDTRSEDAAYAEAIEAGRRNHIGPYEDARDHIDAEWWSHWELITGLKGNRGEYFSCSC